MQCTLLESADKLCMQVVGLTIQSAAWRNVSASHRNGWHFRQIFHEHLIDRAPLCKCGTFEQHYKENGVFYHSKNMSNMAKHVMLFCGKMEFTLLVSVCLVRPYKTELNELCLKFTSLQYAIWTHVHPCSNFSYFVWVTVFLLFTFYRALVQPPQVILRLKQAILAPFALALSLLSLDQKKCVHILTYIQI